MRDDYEMGRKEGKRRSRFLGDGHRFTSEPQGAAHTDWDPIPNRLDESAGISFGRLGV